MKKLLAFCLTIVLLPFLSIGQGMYIDAESYGKIPMFNLADNSRVGTKSAASGAKQEVDLRKFVPEIVKQEGETCVAVATAYYAAGTRLAYLNQVSINPTQFALSPLYHIFRNNTSCNLMQKIEFVADDLASNGGILFSQFNSLTCNTKFSNFQPSFRAVNQSKLCGEWKDTQGNIQKIDCNKAEEVSYNIKLALTNGYPVVTGLPMNNLKEWGLNPNRPRYYKPTTNLKPEGHAITLVGYQIDREQKKTYFIIANSWGNTWGDNGYFYMLEDDLIRNIMQAAIIFSVEPINNNSAAKVLRVNEETKGLGTSFELQDIYAEKQPLIYIGNGVYKTERNYKLHDQFFGIIKNLNSEMYLYVLSQDATDFTVAKHWPRETTTAGSRIDDVLMAKDSPIIFPEPDYPMEITGGTQDHLIILASKKDLSAELPYIIKNLQNFPNKKASISERLEAALSGRMIPANEISYGTQEVSIKLKTLETTRDILPLIIQIDHFNR